MQIQTTIIIPNYNGLAFLKPCLRALSKQTAKDFAILVVDNGSTDGSAKWLQEEGVQAIFLPENTGFSGAVNAGIQACDTPYVILLNNDTEPEPGYVEALERAAARSERIFSVSSRMLQNGNPSLLDDAGDMYTVLGWAFQRGTGRPEKKYRRACRVFAACAGAAIYRRALFDELGLFDESHFAYLEDIDIGYRARLHGYDNLYCPQAAVKHVGSGTSGSKYNSFKVRLTARNSLYLNYKNMRSWQLFLNAPFLLLGFFVKYLFFLKRGFGEDYLAGLREGLSTLHACRRVPAFKGRLKAEIRIQFELILGTAAYVYEFFRRQAVKCSQRPADGALQIKQPGFFKNRRES